MFQHAIAVSEHQALCCTLHAIKQSLGVKPDSDEHCDFLRLTFESKLNVRLLAPWSGVRHVELSCKM